MTGLYCPGCNREFHRLSWNNPQPGDIVICTMCAELGEYDGQQLRNVPMWSTARTPQIEAQQAAVFAAALDRTLAIICHPSSGGAR